MARLTVVTLFVFCCSAVFVMDRDVSIASPLSVDANTVLLMHMDETSEAVTDASAYGNHGIAVGTTIVDGKFGKARSFNPVINFESFDHITVQDSPSLDVQGALTITAWIRPGPQNEGGGVFLSKWNHFTSASYFLGYRSDNKQIHFFISENCDAIGTRLFANSQIPSDGSEWHHVAAVFSPSNYMKVFVDGVETGILTTGIPASICSSSARLIIGAEDGGSRGGDGGLSTPFTGLIDEVRIDSRALSECEIGDLAGNPCTVTVLIDIKPGSFPNSINLGSAGVVPVAILGSPTFDATQVDPASVTLAGARVKLIGKGDKFSCGAQDVNGDSLVDLVCHLMTAEFLIELGESIAVLEAQTFSGQRIRGQDSIQIVP